MIEVNTTTTAMNLPYLIQLYLLFFIGLSACESPNTTTQNTQSSSVSSVTDVEQKVEALLKQMTLEEKIGQMNQYSGFWDLTGPAPKSGDAAKNTNTFAKGM